MWCGFGKSSVSIVTACLITATVASSSVSFAARQRNYTPQEFRSVLRGLGYKITVNNSPLTDKEAIQAIREFQKGYKLGVDGIAGPKTQDWAAQILQILQANLNVVVKPTKLLPRDQFYGPQTEAAVKEAQKKFQLQETGIADLAFRQKLNAEAKSAIGGSQVKPSPTPTATPTAKPTTKPRTTTPSPSPSPTPTASPSPSPTPTVSPSPSPSPSPTLSPSPSPSPTVSPSPSPSPTPSPTP
ncbi:peptidoglycan-binding protein [Tolypothrix sp. FACHB-123]|uniref:peptidoglycan-binding domain-containing protein n=1 Tax=Tolypothrix sp. FACHB-123 TaxID=2692868 RepID=UPI0016836A3A|nr:peptidoglycan-binding protein [Tolypothrix sp. FACHB-123]MBD2354132.1 peptidoglycan-binding protein [Tolypothrix sp. FACHB-123]